MEGSEFLLFYLCSILFNTLKTNKVWNCFNLLKDLKMLTQKLKNAQVLTWRLAYYICPTVWTRSWRGQWRQHRTGSSERSRSFAFCDKVKINVHNLCTWTGSGGQKELKYLWQTQPAFPAALLAAGRAERRVWRGFSLPPRQLPQTDAARWSRRYRQASKQAKKKKKKKFPLVSAFTPTRQWKRRTSPSASVLLSEWSREEPSDWLLQRHPWILNVAILIQLLQFPTPPPDSTWSQRSEKATLARCFSGPGSVYLSQVRRHWAGWRARWEQRPRCQDTLGCTLSKLGCFFFFKCQNNSNAKCGKQQRLGDRVWTEGLAAASEDVHLSSRSSAHPVGRSSAEEGPHWPGPDAGRGGGGGQPDSDLWSCGAPLTYKPNINHQAFWQH